MESRMEGEAMTSNQNVIAEIISVMESARDEGERNCQDLVRIHVGHICATINVLKQLQSSGETSDDAFTQLHGALVRVVLEAEGCPPACSPEFHQFALASVIKIAKAALKRVPAPKTTPASGWDANGSET